MSKYSPEIVERICANLRAKHGRVWSGEEAGISFDTFREWFNHRTEFADAIKKAEEEGRERQKADLLFIIEEAAKKSWQAGAWILERKYSEEFALKTKQDISGYIESSENDSVRRDRLGKLKTFLNKMDIPERKKMDREQVPA